MRSRYAMFCAVLVFVLAACGGGAHHEQAESTVPAASETAPPPPPPAEEPAPVAQQAAPPPPAAAKPAAQKPPAPDPAVSRPAPKDLPPPPPPMATVPAETVLTLALDAGISSKTAQVGDVFTATVVAPVMVGGEEVIPAGATVEGKVTESVPAKRGAGNAKLGLSFDVLHLPGGFAANIVGTFQEVTESKKKRNAAVIGGSAAGGALLGRILGKDTKGAVIGSIIGGGVGTAVVMGKEGEQAKLPPDTPFEIRLEEAVEVPSGGSEG